MLLHPHSQDHFVKSLLPHLVIVDELNQKVHICVTFDTHSKEAEVFCLNEKGEVRVFQNTPITKKVIMPNWRALDKRTNKEIV